MTTCQSCQNWRLKEAGAMAKHGMASCANGPRWTYLPDQSTCQQHKPATAEITAARVAWLQRVSSSARRRAGE